MSDEFDRLRAALKAAPPAPDEGARARALALAMENFDRLQGAGTDARLTEDRRERAGILNGVRSMFRHLSAKPALAATTSVAALVVGVAMFLPVTEALRQGGQFGTPEALPKVAPEAGSGASSAASDARAASESADATGAQAPVVAAVPGADLTAEPVPAPAAEAAAAPVAEDAFASGLPETELALPPAPPAPPSGLVANKAVPGAEYGMAEAAPADMARLEAAPPAETKRARVAEAEIGQAYMDAASAPDLPQPRLLPGSEDFANAAANPVKITAEEPVSTFSTDIDTASWSVLRSTLNAGQLPLPEQVRIEEMVNYFPYSYAAPEGDAAFATTIGVMPTPWNPHTRLVTIGLQGALPEIENRPPLNLVFLIDTSGSMEAPNKLGLLKQSLALMLPELRPEDQVAIVAYAGSAGEVLPPTPAGEADKILAALDGLSAGGSTAGAEGLELAYRLAAQMAGEGEVSRILLATDGDFNVGISDPDGLEAYIAKKRAEGSYLSVLGFGRGNLDDAVMQALAQNGNGTASYIDSLSEARKVLVDQLSGALFPIADDVKVQVEWNPAQVAEYRLIGYETRALAREDFNNDKVDAGEIGAGLQVTAIYEIAAPGSEGLRNDPLRYGEALPAEAEGGELGFLRLRWKAPGESVSQLIETPLTGFEAATEETRFAAAIAGFGQLLQGSPYLGDWSWQQAIDLALASRGADEYGYRIEAVTLMRLAQSLAR